MTKLDAIQQKIDAATKAVADATAKLAPIQQTASDAKTAYLTALDQEANYTTARQEAEIKHREAQDVLTAAHGAVATAQQQLARWQAAWEKALEE